MRTHYAVLVFEGDGDGDHPDEELRGHGPSMTIIAAGPEQFCWEALQSWTLNHPVRLYEHVEVLTRDLTLVMDERKQAGLT